MPDNRSPEAEGAATTRRFFTATDGARLAYRDQGSGLPLVCLPGLTRNGDDFAFVAPHLAGVRLVLPDYRGRGASDYTGAQSYTVGQEAADVLALLDHLDIRRAAVLGTSRGGLIGLWLAATAKDRLLGLCLNDIGPVVDPAGLAHIVEYIGHPPAARTLDEAANGLPAVMPGFAGVPASRWRAFAACIYRQTPEGLALRYDPELRTALLTALASPTPDLWPFFDAAANLPLALIRGANSDLLSRDTLAAMRARRPDMIFAEVANRAHVPFLDEPEALRALGDWLAVIRPGASETGGAPPPG